MVRREEESDGQWMDSAGGGIHLVCIWNISRVEHCIPGREEPQVMSQDKTRNSEILSSFIAYCKAHPEERFWQALRNWSGYSFVLVSDFSPTDKSQEDTFSWEGKSR